MQITIDIPQGSAAEYLDCFLARHPKPPEFVGSNAAWVKEWTLRQLKDAVKAGKRIIAAQAAPVVGDDIT